MSKLKTYKNSGVKNQTFGHAFQYNQVYVIYNLSVMIKKTKHKHANLQNMHAIRRTASNLTHHFVFARYFDI